MKLNYLPFTSIPFLNSSAAAPLRYNVCKKRPMHNLAASLQSVPKREAAALKFTVLFLTAETTGLFCFLFLLFCFFVSFVLFFCWVLFLEKLLATHVAFPKLFFKIPFSFLFPFRNADVVSCKYVLKCFLLYDTLTLLEHQSFIILPRLTPDNFTPAHARRF